MPLTNDRTVEGVTYTAANLNTVWTDAVGKIATQVPRAHRPTVAAWTISEEDPESGFIGDYKSVLNAIAYRLYSNDIATPLFQRFNDNTGWRIWLFDVDSGVEWGKLQKSIGVKLTLRGWVDLLDGTPATVATQSYEACNPNDTEALVGFQDDIQKLIDALNEREQVRVVATSLDAYTAAGTGVGKTLTKSSNGALPQIDGVSLAVGDRLLYAPAAGHADAGVYTVTVLGDGSTPWKLTRATDMDTSGSLHVGIYVFVRAGTLYGATYFELTTSGPFTIETTALTFKRKDYGRFTKHIDINTSTTLDARHNGKILLVDTTGGEVTLTLPVASGNDGFAFVVKNAAGANSVVIDPNGNELIDGGATKAYTQGQKGWVYCTGTAWQSVL